MNSVKIIIDTQENENGMQLLYYGVSLVIILFQNHLATKELIAMVSYESTMMLWESSTIFNPQRACAAGLVCVSVYRILSVTALSAAHMIFESKVQYRWVL